MPRLELEAAALASHDAPWAVASRWGEVHGTPEDSGKALPIHSGSSPMRGGCFVLLQCRANPKYPSWSPAGKMHNYAIMHGMMHPLSCMRRDLGRLWEHVVCDLHDASESSHGWMDFLRTFVCTFIHTHNSVE